MGLLGDCLKLWCPFGRRIESKTGMFFEKQTPKSIVELTKRFEHSINKFSSQACRANAERFRPEMFRSEIKNEFVEDLSHFIFIISIAGKAV